MARIRKINVSEIEGRSPFQDDNAILPNGTLVLYEQYNESTGSNEWILRIHDGRTNGGVELSQVDGSDANTGDVQFDESDIFTETGRMTFYVSGAGEGETNRIDIEADQFTVDVEQDINLYAGTDLELVTNNRGGGARTWTFADDGVTYLPGSTVQGTVTSTYDDTPIVLDVTKAIHKLANGEYSLADGQEGQIIYIVPQTGATPLGVELYITNARVVSNSYSEVINNGLFLPFSGSVNNNLRNVITLIFTDGAWNLSTGEWD
jgi:hypothetical protein